MLCFEKDEYGTMNFWRINTDSSARHDLKTCDLWYKYRMAFAGDYAESQRRHDLVFYKLKPGDGIFMHHSGLGIVGYGVVKEEWEHEVYRGTERLLYVEEIFEYRIAVDWQSDCDCRENPIPIHGWLPYMGTYSYVDAGKWDVQSLVYALRKRMSVSDITPSLLSLIHI
jgi:hypothetical protein